MSFKSAYNIIILLLTTLLNLFFTPLWYLQLLIPRNNKVWIMGAWHGNKYTDNCRSLFEHINNSEDEITSIWLSKNKNNINYIRSFGFKAYYSWGFMGIFYTLKAGIIIFSSNKNDINKYFSNGAILINLWHAAPWKKVELGIKPDKRFAIKLGIFKTFTPWLYPYGSKHTIILSRFFRNTMQNDFRIKEENIFITGFPRNDNLYSDIPSEIIDNIKKTHDNPRIIMYMPTFRDYDRAYNYLQGFDFNLFQSFLTKTDSIFIFKGHYASKTLYDFSNYNRILNYDSYKSNQELYIHIKEIDILITDYSSIFHDFLLLDKPILFTPFDLSKYLKLGRELHYNYDEIVPGPICNDWNDVYLKLNRIISGESNYMKDYKYFKDKYHKYQDACSSKRVFEEIKKRYC